jgi:hypothetical protein
MSKKSFIDTPEVTATESGVGEVLTPEADIPEAANIQFLPEDVLPAIDSIPPIDTDFSSVVGERLITSIPLEKPRQDWFIRVHPDLQFPAYALVDKSSVRDKVFLPSSTVVKGIPQEYLVIVLVRLFMTRQQSLLAWPLRLPMMNNPANTMYESILEIAKLAEKEWVQIRWGGNGYRLYQPRKPFADPAWPSLTQEKFKQLVLKDALIGTLEHPAVLNAVGVEKGML